MIPIKPTLSIINPASLTANSLVVIITMLASVGLAQEPDSKEPSVRDIGSRREPFTA